MLFCLFVMVPIRETVKRIAPGSVVTSDALREALILACAVGLLLFVHYVEKLPFTSIGIGTSVWWKSVLWGVVTAAVCLLAARSCSTAGTPSSGCSRWGGHGRWLRSYR